jgi:secondary thiamine-phosphate synthase enzyme
MFADEDCIAHEPRLARRQPRPTRRLWTASVCYEKESCLRKLDTACSPIWLEMPAARRRRCNNHPMLRQHLTTLSFQTPGRGLHEITRDVREALLQSGLREGLLTLFVRHTSASLLVQENADADVRSDLDRFFARLVPDGDALFEHTSEGRDDMPAHVRSALTAVQLAVPFQGGRLALGTWQGIYLWEHRLRGHRREVAVHALGE